MGPPPTFACVPNVGILGDLRGGGVGAREGGRVQARAFASTGIAGVAEPAPFEAPVPPRVVPPHFGQSGVYVGGGRAPIACSLPLPSGTLYWHEVVCVMVTFV